MTSLAQFPVPPAADVTVCERNGVLLTSHIDNVTVTDYELVDLKCERYNAPHTVSCKEESCKPAFLCEETFLERLKRKWISAGLEGVLGEFSEWKELPRLIRSASKLSASSISTIKTLLGKIGTTFDMSQGVVLPSTESRRRKLASHRHIPKIAFAGQDATVTIISLQGLDHGDVVLKDKRQRAISCLEWRPLSSLSIAVGGQDGVLVWLLDPKSTAARPSTTMTRFLPTPSPVIAISWKPDGHQLVCACENSSSFIVWDILTEESTSVHRLGANLVDVFCSPCGSRVLTTSASNMFRVWETENWQCEKWGNLNGYCTCSCWSPCGSVLLFAVAEENSIYCAQFFPRKDVNSTIDLAGNGVASKCADTSPCSWQTDKGEVQVGGRISEMIWDPTGCRLAVLFSEPQPYVTLYNTRVSPVLQLIPCGFVYGGSSEIPRSVAFLHGYEKGALLVVIWSSERLSAVPLVFKEISFLEFGTSGPSIKKNLRTPLANTSRSQRDLLYSTVDS